MYVHIHTQCYKRLKNQCRLYDPVILLLTCGIGMAGNVTEIFRTKLLALASPEVWVPLQIGQLKRSEVKIREGRSDLIMWPQWKEESGRFRDPKYGFLELLSALGLSRG